MAVPAEQQPEAPASLRFGLACQKLGGLYRNIEGGKAVYAAGTGFSPPTTAELCELPGRDGNGPTYVGLSADRSFVQVVQPASALVAGVQVEAWVDPNRPDAVGYRADADEIVVSGRGPVRVAVRPAGPAA
jgi:hypothetical protein